MAGTLMMRPSGGNLSVVIRALSVASGDAERKGCSGSHGGRAWLNLTRLLSADFAGLSLAYLSVPGFLMDLSKFITLTPQGSGGF